MKKTIEQTYQKKNLHQHILDRPGMYVGSIEPIKEQQWVLDGDKICKKIIEYNPALYKIFDEILVNAIDHTVRDPKMNKIKVNINQEKNQISIYNNGDGIPIQKHKEYNIYVPELIFGNLLTSSSYSNSEKRIIGSVNGLGSKLCSIFSKKFIVETVSNGLYYKQEFNNNMFDKTEPIIKKIDCNTETYTKITFEPDLKRFNLTKLTDDFVSLLNRRVYDAIACSNKNVSVYLNNKKLKGSSFVDYTKMFETQVGQFFYENIIEKDISWDIAIGYNPDAYEQVSFVNGINTNQGGKHCDYVINQVVKKLKELISNKKKILPETLKPSYIKDRLFLFVKSTVVNPEFTSQTKEYLATNSKNFGIKFEITDNLINKLYKSSGIAEDIVSTTKFKTEKNLSKTDGKKRSKLNIENLDDAHWAGTAKSNKCSLILTEGLSAKTFAVSGLSVIGRDAYGIFPLKGVVLNVREATQKQLLNNEEISNIKKILGLQQGKVYKDTKDLRYGSVIFLTDADSDGIHIRGLLINVFHTFWPELLKIKGFLRTMKTPIIKISKRQLKPIEFYTIQSFEEWKQQNNTCSTYDIKYYKGLGTSTAKEAKDLFKRFDDNIVRYIFSSDTDKAIELAFDKKNIAARKEWLQKYDNNIILDQADSDINYCDFIHKELIHFSIYDVIRSIPNMIDGLKPSQRKILFTLFQKKYKKEIKVAQLGAAVAEITMYLHGEVSLFSTIINMAQNYIGSNNINLLEPIGQFGTRLNSKDAASPRYIFTRLEEITKVLFNNVDFNTIKYKEEEGVSIEPEFYIPILPMILVNGSVGIGTGYSTNIPCYNPLDIIENMKRVVKNKTLKPMIPWYKGFKGKIIKEEGVEGSYLIYSVIKSSNDNKTLNITEIPIGLYVDVFINFIKECIENDNKYDIIDYKNNCDDTKIDITITFNKEQTFDDKFLKKLKLIKSISTRNFHLFDENCSIKKYEDPNHIIKDFVGIRLKYNQLRKEYLLNSYNNELSVLNNKIRFLEEIMNDILVVYKKSRKEIIVLLESNKYDMIENSFNYLLEMPISSFSTEKLEALKNKKNEVVKMKEVLEIKTVIDILEEDLEKLE